MAYKTDSPIGQFHEKSHRLSWGYLALKIIQNLNWYHYLGLFMKDQLTCNLKMTFFARKVLIFQ